jgi:hypothetical protein
MTGLGDVVTDWSNWQANCASTFTACQTAFESSIVA